MLRVDPSGSKWDAEASGRTASEPSPVKLTCSQDLRRTPPSITQPRRPIVDGYTYSYPA